MRGDTHRYDHEVVEDGDAGEDDRHVVGLQETSQVGAHVAHALRVQLVETLQHHDGFAEDGGSVWKGGKMSTLGG